MNELTVIIPFLNEGVEVYNTVKNLKETSKVNIILINDASTDDFDYLSIAKQFNVRYIKHRTRKGVAVSRDEAINLCQTKYFLLLDAHMRVFQDDWANLIVKELKRNERTLYCCKTIALDSLGNILDLKESFTGYGAYFDSELMLKWISFDINPSSNTNNIPCVLGASYACSKEYWQYLNGLKGLRLYGFDEQLISFKVWMEGGKCKLLKKVTFGHIFRTRESVPYKEEPDDFLYNRLYLIELLINSEKFSFYLKERIKIGIGKERFDYIKKLVDSPKSKLIIQKESYNNIFLNGFDYILRLNDKVSKIIRLNEISKKYNQ